LKQLKCTDDTNYLVKVSTKLADRIENYDEDEETMMLNRLFLLNRWVWTMMNEDDDDDSDDDDHRDKPDVDDDDDDEDSNKSDYSDDEDDDED
jgi:hypothetical protein